MKDYKRYRLKEDEWKLVDEYRNDKKRQNLLAEECNHIGIKVRSSQYLQNQMNTLKMTYYNLLRSLSLTMLLNIHLLIILLDKMVTY